jgi:hypothetical protein
VSDPRASHESGDLELSLVRGDPAFRLQRKLGLIPARGLGAGRRALLFAAVSWLPIAIWALLTGHAMAPATGEPLFQHFGVTTRCLLAIPLLVLAEGLLHTHTRRLMPQFLRSGLVKEDQRARFLGILQDIARLRDRLLPWIMILGLIAVWTLLAPALQEHELMWAEAGSEPRGFGFGGWWFLWVARPIYVLLVAAWAWRLALLFLLLRRIAALDLAVVPTHADRAGGLGFLAQLPMPFGLVALAISVVIAGRWAHDVVYHGVQVTTLRLPAVVFVVVLCIAMLLPYVAFSGPLRKARRQALLDYSALVGRHGRMVRERWILHGSPRDAELLSAPEIGPVADTVSLYDAVTKMRTLPIDRGSLLAIAVPALIPMLAVYAIQVPIKEILLKLVKAAL